MALGHRLSASQHFAMRTPALRIGAGRDAACCVFDETSERHRGDAALFCSRLLVAQVIDVYWQLGGRKPTAGRRKHLL